jgi:hypothetical protein
MTTPSPTYNPTPSNPIAGSLITITGTFVSTSTGLPADPTTIVVKVAQGGTTSSYTYPNAYITKVSTGVYSIEVDTTGQSGPGTAEFTGTGAVQAINAWAWFTTPAPL